MKEVEIKIDRSTLPKDGQKIKWQTQDDFDLNQWKEGQFCEGDDIFCEGFENIASKWDLSFSVLHWIAID